MKTAGPAANTARFMLTRYSVSSPIPSVSVLQWLCNADRAANSPPQRLARFFNTLFASLARGARAVFQFYPESDDQVNLIMGAATKAGFSGGLVVDYPNSKKAKKFYLCLMAGTTLTPAQMPAALGTHEGAMETDDRVAYEKRREKKKGHSQRSRAKEAKGDRDWILRKKALYRQRGKESVPNDSK